MITSLYSKPSCVTAQPRNLRGRKRKGRQAIPDDPHFWPRHSATRTSRILVGRPSGQDDVIAIDELAAEPSGKHQTDYADGRHRHAPRHLTSIWVVQSQCPIDYREHNYLAVVDGVRPPNPLLARARYLAEFHVS